MRAARLALRLLATTAAACGGPTSGAGPRRVPNAATEDATAVPAPADAATAPTPSPDAPAAPADVAAADRAVPAEAAVAARDVAGDRAASGPDGAPAAGCAGARLCDDFEAYATGSAPGGRWKVTKSPDGVVAIDTTRAFSGARSVHLIAPAGSNKNALISQEGAPLFPLPGDDMFGRMMIWLKQAPPPQATAIHWDNIIGEGTAVGKTFHAIVRYGGFTDKLLMANYFTYGPNTDYVRISKTTRMPEQRWACIEWEYDQPHDTANFWLDGAAVPDLTVVEKGDDGVGNDTNGIWYFPAFDAIRVGWEHFQTSPIPYEMWIDDVAIDTKRIGCPPPR